LLDNTFLQRNNAGRPVRAALVEYKGKKFR
jgi:hypothetical protein